MAEVNLTLKPNNDAPRISRSRLSEIRSDLEPRYDDVALVVTELVSNSIRHSGNGEVTVSIWASNDRIRLEVSDHGPCFDIDRPRDDGLGLSIVNEVADVWGVDQSGECTVWVEMARPGTDHTS
jgi:anti-sigma regulatory factor (Ser/Thr protein kinase)